MNNKIDQIKDHISKFYNESSDDYSREWCFERHVLVVAKYAEEICNKHDIDPEVSVLASLFHDVAWVHSIYDDEEHMTKTLEMTQEIMVQYGYEQDKIGHVQSIIKVHSCHGDDRPTTPEGKAMVTADALAHFTTDFYTILAFNKKWLIGIDSYDEYRAWVLKKIEKDFNKKIMFEDYEEVARPRYEALKTVFSSPS